MSDELRREAETLFRDTMFDSNMVTFSDQDQLDINKIIAAFKAQRAAGLREAAKYLRRDNPERLTGWADWLDQRAKEWEG